MGNPTSPTPPAPLLSLETILPFDFILINGHRCELRQQAALSLFELRKFERMRERMQLLQAIEDPTPADELELEALLGETCRLVLVQPNLGPSDTDLVTGLPPQYRMRVVLAFLRLSRARRVALAALEVDPAEVPAAAEELPTTSS